MLKVIHRGVSNQHFNLVKVSLLKRDFLSSAFALESEFNARLNNRILKQVNPSTMYLELDQQLNRFKKLHAIDVDLYVNSITKDIHTEELEDILYKFRLTPSTIDMLDSTQHAFIRLYLKLNKVQDLMKILDDRLNYGIFPDEYCNNLLMNHFIKTNNFRDASKVAAFQMLQEDFSNEITKQFSLYSCLKYLESPTQWSDETNETEATVEDVDEEEIVKVRVDFLRNPFFDGHFDLKSPNDLIGKTLMSIGRTKPDDVLSQSYYLVGLGLTKNILEAQQFLEAVESGKIKVAKNALEMFQKYITTGDVSQTASVSKELASPEGENAETSPSKPTATITEEVQALLSRSETLKSKATEIDLLEVTEKKLKEIVQKFEAGEIEKQKQKYKQWDEERVQILQRHVEKLKEEEIFETIKQKKAELAAEEERIFYFDNENKIDLLLEEKYPPKEEVVVKKRNEFDGKRNLGLNTEIKSKKKQVDDSYIPPDLHKPYNN